jgi:hypothetical protein
MLLQWPVSDFRTMDYSGMFPCALIKTELPPAGTVPLLSATRIRQFDASEDARKLTFCGGTFPRGYSLVRVAGCTLLVLAVAVGYSTVRGRLGLRS